ncbi:very short patch repair endonuclease [Rhizobium laguerreae]|uniref:very short patch repair endonuclease n=1 Tax=Rhizobium laguerreae TaxID=1076926 RepID=UPI0014416CF8|nr:very short patch repair endonuclease [Rhizobium laguerreae]NKM27884.1 DNA mismatch endonuclease Vsr [Rhizobium laguerreae]
MGNISPDATTSSRSRNMARIKSKDTGPELTVRRLVHSLGYRYRLHVRGLPGTPDLVFRSRKKVIFVHGCYWHAHLRYDPSCKRARPAKSNREYWGPKLERNVARDQANLSRLADDGWDVLVLWECELKDAANAALRITQFLGLRNMRQPYATLENL